MRSQIREIYKCRAVVGDDVVDVVLIVFGKNRLQAHPLRNFVLGIFLEKEIVVDAVGIALERERTVAQVGDDQVRDGVVIVDQVAFGDPFAGKQHLIEIREFEAMPVHGDESSRPGGFARNQRLALD